MKVQDIGATLVIRNNMYAHDWEFLLDAERVINSIFKNEEFPKKDNNAGFSDEIYFYDNLTRGRISYRKFIETIENYTHICFWTNVGGFPVDIEIRLCKGKYWMRISFSQSHPIQTIKEIGNELNCEIKLIRSITDYLSTCYIPAND